MGTSRCTAIAMTGRERSRGRVAVMVVALVVAFASNLAKADEGGVSFWLPGFYGSLAAAPVQPGWSFASIYYHATAGASGEVAAAREVTIGRFNPNVNVNLNVNLSARPDIEFLTSAYTFATPVLGGQLTVSLSGAFGHLAANLDGSLTLAVNNLVATRAGTLSDERFGFADLYPQASLRWNNGVHNFMTYVAGDVPVGTYDPSRLANFGIGHAAIDSGLGYTYFDPKTGHELSVVSGLTYNFENPFTNYQNGIDWHLDWGASQFLTKQLQVGLVGYFYHQLTGDIGAAPFLGENLSRIAGIGPQIGYLFPVGNMQGYVNLKGYYEFDASRRADGWNVWLTFSISPAAAAPETTKRPMFTK
jgi:hypothetical protein